MSRVKPRKSGNNPFEEMFLARMRQEIEAKAPTDPIGVELTKAAGRIERKQLATKADFVSAARHLRSDLRGVEDLPLDATFESCLDPREEDPEFLALSPEEQALVREEWAYEQQRAEQLPRRMRRERTYVFMSAMVVFLIVALMLAPIEGFGPMPGLLLTGAVTGTSWMYIRRTRFTFMLSGLAAYLGGNGVGYVFGTGAFSELADQSLTLLFAAALISFGCGIVGCDCEMRHSGGFRQG